MSWRDWLNRQISGLRIRLTGEPRKTGDAVVGGRRLEEWEQGWRRIGLLPSAHLTAPGETVGLFRLRQGGNIVFLGCSHGSSADCLRLTLRGLVHGGAATGTLLNQRLREWGPELVVEILITGCSEITTQLEQHWLQQLSPPWNQLESHQMPVRTATATLAAVQELNLG